MTSPDTKTKLWMAGGLCAAVLVGSLVYTARRKKNDELAAKFFIELDRQISPGNTDLSKEPAFDMNYWQNLVKAIHKPYITLKSDAALNYAKTIHKAWGTFNDDEDAVYGVYRALMDKVAASQVAWMYYTAVADKVNLIDDLRSRMSKDEVGKIMQIVNNLPPYRTPDPVRPGTTRPAAPRPAAAKPMKKK